MSFYKIKNTNLLTKICAGFVIITGIYSCANMASPSGGDYDLDPPKVIRSNPGFNALNVKNQKIEIVFDELIQLEKPNEKVIITPPQKNLPNIQAVSNKVRIELKDTLLTNTTYTIDFTDAISDYNEKNALENFSISFSTGDIIDSLVVSGKVLTADNLEPVSGMYVGLHSNLNDSAFMTEPFLRISRTNDRGEFSIRGIAEGEYHVYALNDLNRDYKYDNPSEAIAFYNTSIIPSTAEATRTDTIFNKDLTVDTIIHKPYTRFLPDDIMLRSFTSAFKRQYLLKHERPQDDLLKVYFGSPTEMPELKPINFEAPPNWTITEKNITNDTINYWIINDDIANIDTLRFSLTYLKTDTLNQIIETADTLSFINRAKKNRKEKQKKDEEEKIVFLNLNTNLNQAMDVYNNIAIEFGQPVRDFPDNKFKLSLLVDTIFTEQTFSITQDSLNPRKYEIVHKWQPGAEYRLEADSAVFFGYDGKWNNKVDTRFSVKSLDTYGNLAINIDGLQENENAFVELLDQSDKPLRFARVIDSEVLFMNLTPGKYYARIILDENDNGIWDTGDYYTLRQPETVYYYDKSFDIKANWNLEESWNILSLPLNKQKPLEITKNKPQEKESKRQQLEKQESKDKRQRDEDEEQRRQNQLQMGGRTLN